jgi:hypothetical protein
LILRPGEKKKGRRTIRLRPLEKSVLSQNYKTGAQANASTCQRQFAQAFRLLQLVIAVND